MPPGVREHVLSRPLSLASEDAAAWPPICGGGASRNPISDTDTDTDTDLAPLRALSATLNLKRTASGSGGSRSRSLLLEHTCTDDASYKYKCDHLSLLVLFSSVLLLTSGAPRV